MSEQEVEVIKQIFIALKLNPTYHEHEAVITSEEAAKTRGVPIESGIKALLLKNGVMEGDDSWVIVDIPANKKADLKKVAEKLCWSKNKIRMATPQEVEERTGCIIGAVPPFGHKKRTKILVDEGVYDNKESNFNIGLRTISARIKTTEMKILFNYLKAVEGEYAKE